MSQIVLISISGVDRPGITHRLTSVLAEHGVRVLDLGQAVIHKTLNLGILIELGAEDESAPVLKDLLYAAHELDLASRFTPVSEGEYETWVKGQDKARYIVTVLGPEIEARHLARVSEVIAKHELNIAVITRLSGRTPLRDESVLPRGCVELSVRGTPRDLRGLRREFLDLAQELTVDIALQVDDVFRRTRRMVAFDMDSTLIRTEVIDELAAAKGVGAEVAAITEAAMNGQLDFDQSLRRRLSLLEGLDVSVMDEIAERLPLSPGAEHLISTLRSLGFTTAILSGGFTYFGHYLQKKLGIDHVHANELEIKDGKLTGHVVGPIVNGARKAQLLLEIAEREGIRREQIVAVGDGANDLPMLDVAGLGIAYHAKPKVKQTAEQALDSVGLDGVLYLLGMRDRELPPVS
jgi:phosphoserine phosphatase